MLWDVYKMVVSDRQSTHDDPASGGIAVPGMSSATQIACVVQCAAGGATSYGMLHPHDGGSIVLDNQPQPEIETCLATVSCRKLL